jgi:hypothetical protein
MLHDLQQHYADELQADPYFGDIEVITERKGNIAKEIETEVAKIGLCVVMLTPIANIDVGVSGQTYFDDIKLFARVYENVLVNKTGKAALDVAENIVRVLNNRESPLSSSTLVAANPTISLGNDPDILSYDVLFKTAGGILDDLVEAAAPIITRNGAGQVVMSCATPGAAIFYTNVAGQTPSPRSGSLYVGPLSAPPNTLFRARAWLAGFLASAITKTRI